MVISNLALMKGLYTTLQQNGVVKSQADFSRRFLLRNQSYLRSMWTRQRSPSKAVMAQLEWSLQQEVARYEANPHLNKPYCVHLNAAYECLDEQLKRVRSHRLQKTALESAVGDNDNHFHCPDSPCEASLSKIDDLASYDSSVVFLTRRL